MAITDFLFNGSAPPSTTTYGSTSTNMPTWYNDYVQGLIGKANAVAATEYQPYTGGPRVAENPQLQASAEILGTDPKNNLNTQFNQNISPALATMKGMQGPDAANALNQYGGAAMRNYENAMGLNSQYGAAGNLINQAGTTSSMSPEAQNAFNQAQMYNPMAAGSGYLGASAGLTGAAGLTPSTANIGQYMNPYTNNVVNEIGRLGKDALDQNLSNISDRFVAGGGFGGSRMGQSMGNAARASQRDILGQQNQALQSGYGQALGASQADLARQLQAGSQLGNLGSTAGSLANQSFANLSGLGQSLAGLQGQDLSRQLQAGQGLGSLTSTQQQNLGSLGQSLGAFGQSDLARQMDAAKGQGALSQTINDQAIKNAGALEALGQTQANQQQKQLDVNYQNYLNQLNYPKDQLSFMNNIIRGMQVPTSSTTTQTGPASTYQASPLSQIASAATGAAGLSKLFG